MEAAAGADVGSSAIKPDLRGFNMVMGLEVLSEIGALFLDLGVLWFSLEATRAGYRYMS